MAQRGLPCHERPRYFFPARIRRRHSQRGLVGKYAPGPVTAGSTSCSIGGNLDFGVVRTTRDGVDLQALDSPLSRRGSQRSTYACLDSTPTR
jgi:hypothetical protein